MTALFDEKSTLVVACSCGHVAQEHHGVDRHPVNGGCFGDGSGLRSGRPKCSCEMTCGDVLEAVSAA